MPRALSPEVRAERAEQQARQIKEGWLNKLASLMPLQAEALTTFDATAVKPRELWLILAVFELQEDNAHKGTTESVKSAWLDRIAPRARGIGTGVSGFASRTAGQLSQFMRISGNGYVYLKDAGYALVSALRERHPQMRRNDGSCSPLELSEDFVVPYLGWRRWTSPVTD